MNELPDTGKRRLQVNTKDHFWPVTPRVKHVVETWMKDLAGNKPLSVLGKKVPIFNKREEIFLILAEHSVPLLRAAWFLKMTASYNSAISEAKTKKRQMPDPSQGNITNCGTKLVSLGNSRILNDSRFNHLLIFSFQSGQIPFFDV